MLLFCISHFNLPRDSSTLQEVSRAVSQLCDNLDDGLESVVDKDLILSKTPFTRGGGLGGVDGDVCRGPIEVSPESNDGRHAHSNGRLTMQFDEAAYEDGGEYDQSSHASHHQVRDGVKLIFST